MTMEHHMSTFKLLTTGNPKIEKGTGRGYLTFILHLAPADLSGWNVCPMATEGCKAACLNTAGRGGMMAGVARLTLDMLQAGKVNTIQAARIRKTRRFFQDREGFMTDLAKEIDKAVRYAEKRGLVPVFRLNGTSDIRWERVPVSVGEGMARVTFANVMALFPHATFYDYTKIANRRDLPSNYHLTFSLAENNDPQAFAALANGLNVAVVFRTKAQPESFMGVPVFCGDESDLRFLDPRGVVVGLYAKGNAKADTTGFVRD
jgi:hypothetical protein